MPAPLFSGTCTDPHAFLGLHDWEESQKILRIYDPAAESVEIICGKNQRSLPMKSVGGGLFVLIYLLFLIIRESIEPLCK